MDTEDEYHDTSGDNMSDIGQDSYEEMSDGESSGPNVAAPESPVAEHNTRYVACWGDAPSHVMHASR